MVLYRWFTKSLFGDLVNPNKLILYGTENLKFMEE